MPCYLYKIQVVRPEMLIVGPTEEEQRIVGEHFQYLQRLMEKGILILAGRTQTTDYSSFGIGLFMAESDEAMREIAQNDPVVKNRVMRAEWYPYRIALFKPENAAE